MMGANGSGACRLGTLAREGHLPGRWLIRRVAGPQGGRDNAAMSAALLHVTPTDLVGCPFPLRFCGSSFSRSGGAADHPAHAKAETL